MCWYLIRPISLGALSDTSFIPDNRFLVYWLDLYWWTARFFSIRRICRRIATAGTNYTKSPRYVHTTTMARNALLLGCFGVFCCCQYLGVKDFTSYQPRCWWVLSLAWRGRLQTSKRLTWDFPGVLHVIGFVVIVSVLGSMSSKHTATYVFAEFSNTSGWTNDGVSWLVGLLSTVYPFLG